MLPAASIRDRSVNSYGQPGWFVTFGAYESGVSGRMWPTFRPRGHPNSMGIAAAISVI